MMLLWMVAHAQTPRVSPPIVRGDGAAGFEVRVGEGWFPLGAPRGSEVEVLPIGPRFLVVEKAYEGGNGLGCETHVLTVAVLRDQALVRQESPRIELGTACWNRNRVQPIGAAGSAPGHVESPFLAPVVRDEVHFELVHRPVSRVQEMSSFGPLVGTVPRASIGVWTVDGQRPPTP